MVYLKEEQRDAVEKMHNGCILHGGTGVGKSITSIAYFFIRECGGMLDGKAHGYSEDYVPMKHPKDLYIITTAKKRDDKDWEKELSRFLISKDQSISCYPDMKVVIDSWNNIGKYKDIRNAFFLFDEQRVVGYGPWVKAFLKIAEHNHWVLLSATPGDKWIDYLPVFIANGFFRNKTEFLERHAVMGYSHNHWEIRDYRDEGRLWRYQQKILVNMKSKTSANKIWETVPVEYDRNAYRDIVRSHWNPYTDEPIRNAPEYCQALRRVVNTDVSRIGAVYDLLRKHPKVVIFYNYDYELQLLKDTTWDLDITIAEWNGHKHEPIPKTECWMYLVQYTAGCEGWNCLETDTIIFYSMNYSYKVMLQAAGRTDRMNTPYEDLYYYRLKSASPIDLAISRALKEKKKFNERSFVG